jgi:hypothetical protein
MQRPQRVHAHLTLRDRPTEPGRQPSGTWLTLAELDRDEARHAHTISLHGSEDGPALAQALVLPARHARVLRSAGFAEASLERCALIANVVVREGAESLLPTLLYCAGRRARIEGVGTLVTGVSDLEGAAARLLGLSRLGRQGPEGLVLAAQRMDLWMHRSYAASVAAGHAPAPELLADEVAQSIRAWVSRAPEWTFFEALRARKLARQQYVYTMSNLYQFVRHTTRLIGRAISHSADTDLRRHWIGHLNGEINHEVIIEKDLAHLGEDVTFVVQHMPPSSRTQEFMAIQESMIAYYQDPVLFMASPLAAEAITAHLNPAFVEDLNACVASWGVADPQRATRFLTSHMSTDGGDDGHFLMSLETLPRWIHDESRLALFLTTNASSRRAIEGVWSTCIADTAIWSDL